MIGIKVVVPQNRKQLKDNSELSESIHQVTHMDGLLNMSIETLNSWDYIYLITTDTVLEATIASNRFQSALEEDFIKVVPLKNNRYSIDDFIVSRLYTTVAMRDVLDNKRTKYTVIPFSDILSNNVKLHKEIDNNFMEQWLNANSHFVDYYYNNIL